MLNLVGTKDLAALLKLQLSTVESSVTKRPGFPKPVVNGLRINRRWALDEVMEYLRPKSTPPTRRTGPLDPVPWADLSAMAEIYERARRLSAETGVKHHVDHVLPVNGKLVSGLHVETNLQILTATENIKKTNYFEVT